MGCSINVINHDADEAGRAALSFSERAFVRRDFNSAFELITHTKSGSVTVEQIQNLVQEMHPDGQYPSTVELSEYEVIPGKPIIRVFLKSSINGSNAYYLIVVEGQRGTGYEVTELYKSENQFPMTYVPRKSFK